jgi:hypothetical protein
VALAELVATRAAELRRAYPDIVSIGYGRRTVAGRQGKRARMGELTLKFLVKRKWRPHSRMARSPRALPNPVLAYWSVAGTRALVAVPTDVDELLDYRELAPQARPRWVVAANAARKISESGSFTCGVRIAGDAENVYALSAAHVFDLTKDYWPSLPSKVTLTDGEGGAVMGEVTDFAGKMVRSHEGISLDAALAKITDVTALAAMLGAVLPRRAVKSALDIPKQFQFSTNRGWVKAGKATVWSHHVLDYELRDGSKLSVQHETLVESDADTEPGDSGAPAISLDGTTLLGMNIYGGQGLSFMIPANVLLDANNYSSLSAGQTLSLMTGLTR